MKDRTSWLASLCLCGRVGGDGQASKLVLNLLRCVVDKGVSFVYI